MNSEKPLAILDGLLMFSCLWMRSTSKKLLLTHGLTHRMKESREKVLLQRGVVGWVFKYLRAPHTL